MHQQDDDSDTSVDNREVNDYTRTLASTDRAYLGVVSVPQRKPNKLMIGEKLQPSILSTKLEIKVVT